MRKRKIDTIIFETNLPLFHRFRFFVQCGWTLLNLILLLSWPSLSFSFSSFYFFDHFLFCLFVVLDWVCNVSFSLSLFLSSYLFRLGSGIWIGCGSVSDEQMK